MQKHKRDGNEEQNDKRGIGVLWFAEGNASVWLDRVEDELREWVEWLEGALEGCRWCLWCNRNAGLGRRGRLRVGVG